MHGFNGKEAVFKDVNKAQETPESTYQKRSSNVRWKKNTAVGTADEFQG